MKKYVILSLMFFMVASGALAYDNNNNIKDGIKYDISPEEISAISHMREEEKIARDVYIKLYEKWGIKSFDNIKDSEQKHMDAIKVLIDKYDLEDSMKSNEVGIFNATEFKKLYDDLIAKGMKSEIDALQVGMTIEDVDIYDLERYLAETKNEDIKIIFNNLNQGSMNHAKAFQRQLNTRDGEYKAQYVSAERMKEILKSSNSKTKNQRKFKNRNKNKQKENINLRVNNSKKITGSFFDKVFRFLKFWNWF